MLAAFVIAGVFGSIGGMVMSLFVSGAFPDFAYWTISGEAMFMIMLGGISLFLGPLAGAVMLLMLNDIVTKHTEHYSLVLGLIILLFALGLRKGFVDYLAEIWQRRKAAQDAAPARRAARRGATQGARPTTRMSHADDREPAASPSAASSP